MDRHPLDVGVVELGRLGVGADSDRWRPFAGVRSRIGLLVAGQVLVAALFARLTLGAGSTLGDPRAIAALAVAFGVGGSFTMRLEFKRHQCTFTLIEAVLSVAFFVAGPLGVAIAAAAGEAVVLVVHRVSPLKMLFNVTNRFAAATVAGIAFQAIGYTDFAEASAWAAAIVGVLCFSLLDVVATAAVLAIAERASFQGVLLRSVPTAALTTFAAAPLGPIGFELYRHETLAPLLLVPLVVAVALNSRHAAAQRDEHLRFERLYAASARTARLAGFDEALGLLAAEARSLGTGVAAVCCSTDTSGTWVGALVDDVGTRAAPAEVVGELVRTASRSGSCELEAEAPSDVAGSVHGAQSLLLATAPADAAGPLVVAVWRAGRTDDSADGRVETLAAFASHASLTAANARLYEERELALAHQVDLNRQKGDFVAAVSHELRTPLAVMLGAMGTMTRLEGRLGEEKRRQLMDTAVDQGGRLQRLINELLVVAAAEHETVTIAHRPVAVAQLLAQVVRDTARVVEGRLSAHVDGDVDNVVTDPVKLQQIISNLVENAGKYAPDGPVSVRVSRVGEEVRFAVEDHGPGIPVEDRERVFQRFVQLDQSSTRRQGGTGLGLYLCRQLAGLLGGSLVLDEAPGGGCLFTLAVPAAEAVPEPASAEGECRAPVVAQDDDAGVGMPEGVRARPAGDLPAGFHARPAGMPEGVRARPDAVAPGVSAEIP